eukprot:GHVH01015698.1.p1 GENE.GHVH01015698.1~~GHVH01015698.1.p1  ORF type:complete len:247 (+),score=23.53 GHVH01015698.1:110-850(+)
MSMIATVFTYVVGSAALMDMHGLTLSPPALMNKRIADSHDKSLDQKVAREIKPFFYVKGYDEDDSCYSEFFSGVKTKWSDCCSLPENVKSSNCDVLFIDDVCYPYMIPGKRGIHGGFSGEYYAPKWNDCCTRVCTSRTCPESEYCRPSIENEKAKFQFYFMLLLLACSAIACCGIAVAICCVCCVCKKCCRPNCDEESDHSESPRVILTGPVDISKSNGVDLEKSSSKDHEYYSSDDSSEYKKSYS